jgi:hypothetical protein
MNILSVILGACSLLLFTYRSFCASQKEPVGQNLIILLVDGEFFYKFPFIFLKNIAFGATLFNGTDSRVKFGAKTLLEVG